MNPIDEYVNQFDGIRKEWILEFTQFMDMKHPELFGVIWFRMPTYKIDCFYIAFSVTKLYFAVHTNDSECFAMLKAGLDKASFGKKSARIKYSDEGAKRVIYNTIEFFSYKYRDGKAGEMTNHENGELVIFPLF